MFLSEYIIFIFDLLFRLVVVVKIVFQYCLNFKYVFRAFILIESKFHVPLLFEVVFKTSKKDEQFILKTLYYTRTIAPNGERKGVPVTTLDEIRKK